jgi:hypothetical protein
MYKSISNRLVFPAIAITVEIKSDFECPRDHVDELCNKLKLIKKIIIISWRATEDPFLKLLSKHLSWNTDVMIIDKGGADSVKRNLQSVAQLTPEGGATFTLSDEGFTRFELQRQAIDFLTREAPPPKRPALSLS